MDITADLHHHCYRSASTFLLAIYRSSIHGGVCIYLNELIHFAILDDLTDKTDGLEVLWITIRPHRLPRGISNIIIGLVHHPPTANNSVMLDYLTSCLSDIESKHPNTGIILLGDPNQLNDSWLKSNFDLKQIIHFPTRGGNTLDKILTNLKTYYNPPIKRPAFGLSDLRQVKLKYSQSNDLNLLKLNTPFYSEI